MAWPMDSSPLYGKNKLNAYPYQRIYCLEPKICSSQQRQTQVKETGSEDLPPSEAPPPAKRRIVVLKANPQLKQATHATEASMEGKAAPSTHKPDSDDVSHVNTRALAKDFGIAISSLGGTCTSIGQLQQQARAVDLPKLQQAFDTFRAYTTNLESRVQKAEDERSAAVTETNSLKRAASESGQKAKKLRTQAKRDATKIADAEGKFSILREKMITMEQEGERHNVLAMEAMKVATAKNFEETGRAIDGIKKAVASFK
ncbi:hypothetical protein LTR08_006393 [Meristemomyces frigidus]|nr:hypothetical protein LTR08_006393 [Meristemomyces frigidus]